LTPKLDVHVTRGVEGRPPDIWLTVGADIVRPVIVRLTIDEALLLGNRLLVAAAEAATNREETT